MTSDTQVPKQLWQTVQPLLPHHHAATAADLASTTAALAGIVYQFQTGIPWRLLPARQLGCGSPVTCWRRLRDWQRAGVWQRLHQRLLDQLGRNGQLDWSRASLDSLSVRAKRGRANRPEPDRPRQARLQGPLLCRSAIQQLDRDRQVTQAERCEAPDRNPVLHTALSGQPAARDRSLHPLCFR
jgi:transposase